MIQVREFQPADGTAPFSNWFDALPAGTADRVDTALRRMRHGNFGDAKRVGDGVFERRLHQAAKRLWVEYTESKRSRDRWD